MTMSPLLRKALLCGALTGLFLAPFQSALAITQNQIASEVQIVCPGAHGSWYSGSGTIIDPKGIILTNKHVVTDEDGSLIEVCIIGFIEDISREPNFGTYEDPNLAEVKYNTNTDDMDTAILYLSNHTNKTYSFIDIWNSNSASLRFGDKVEVIGFPSIGGSTITYSSGDFSGFGSGSDGTQNFIKTTVPLEHGNSGGAAYDPSGRFVGIPTMVVAGELNSLSYILSINSIKNWLSGILGATYSEKIIEQPSPSTLPQKNIQQDITPPDITKVKVQFYDCSKWYTEKTILGELKSSEFWLGPADCTPLPYDPKRSFNVSPETIFARIMMPVEVINDIYTWDSSSFDNEPRTDRFMGFGTRSEENRVAMMESLREGFKGMYGSGGQEGPYYYSMQLFDSNGNASQVGVWKYNYSKTTGSALSSTQNIDPQLIARVKGYILLQTESHGEAWYVDPITLKRYYMKDGVTAYSMMRSFGLGVSELDYSKIAAGNVTLKSRLAGKIVLRAQAHGEAYYIHPKDLSVHYLQNGDEAYRVMRLYSLGITNANLQKVPEGDLNAVIK